MAVFHAVATAGSFTLAARRLDQSVASVSRHVTRLEDELGARLLQRSTRRLALTEVGEEYARTCARIIEEAETAHAAVRHTQREPAGTIRIGTTHSLARTLAPFLREFVDLNPGVRLDVFADDAVSDIVQERIDLAIRGGQMRDSTLHARKLADLPAGLVAAPAFLQRTGMPRSPEELAGRDFVGITLAGVPDVIELADRSGRTWKVRCTLRHRTNSIVAHHAMLEQGFGLGWVVLRELERQLADGTLVRVLPKLSLPPLPLWAVFPSREHLPLHVRLCVEHLVEALSRPGLRRA